MIKYPCDAFIIRSASPPIDDRQLMWVDGYCQTGAMTVSLSILRIVGGNTSVMDSSEQITYKLPYLQDQKL
jgi:hypothetical protein